ncbi:dipeptide/oligopeptide/nickel ABC transporter permease/ATP-binding protein [Streptomyces sp. ME02-6978a]|uniref:dipeptide/oligopeptide/nickel ABC transporter permease/ATP-binding protein n=1 Tax=unclassified Streptomyces TaxID=2593676 RepID=UPI0029A76EB6|nr:MULTISPECIES: dipeptide/oligopeptide/nickel ABC transporter permease/ATP-binding protein [unclassified Streptomyces]MDX3088701.1 dipeptide/oligopeptide/nickel ABC transporter permease/ATP-binding protein [Streptomyces sp. ME12-02E]MDX3331783.1 dipeptide/oligopeptide/nickel ABC transporter permease/ATP-binding protein [Streptomyces sp. ME02-6978a]
MTTTAPETPTALPAAADAHRGILRSVLRTPRGSIAGGFLLLLILATLLAPVLAPADPLRQNLHHVLETPSSRYWLGTDSLGRDLLSRLLYGGRPALAGVLEGVLAQLVVAVPLGVATGYLGGRFDRFVMRVCDIVMSVPTIVILLGVLTIFDRSIAAAMITLGVLSAAGTLRVVRGAAMTVRQELYVSAAELLGLGRVQIIFRHILPRCRGVIIVQTSLFAAVAIGIQTGLTFLGLGPPPPSPTWGGMINESAVTLSRAPWLLVPAGGLIALTVLAFGILGDVVRDVTAQSHTSSGGLRARPASGRRTAEAPVEEPGSGTEAPALLRVRDLDVTFLTPRGEREVLTEVGFDVRAGRTLGLVGESGSGKSVTARAVLGLLEANGAVTGGSVRFRGRELTRASRKELAAIRGTGIALISQEPMVALDPSFRIGAQLGEVVRAHTRMSRGAARRRVLELLEMVELPDPEEIVTRYPFQISGGMAQRVAIAAALAGSPELLIADEPTTALDVTVQADILALLRRIQADTGMAVLIVTHDWGVVADICSDVAVMYAGQVVESAPVEDVFAHPSHPYTAALMAAGPEHAPRRTPIKAVEGTVPPPGDRPAGCRFRTRCPLAEADCAEQEIPLLPVGEHRTSRCIHTAHLEARR